MSGNLPVSPGFVREGLFVAVIALSAGCLYLVRSERSLRAQLDDAVKHASEPSPGIFVPPYSAETLDGTSVELGRQGERQLLFFFNTSCTYCRESLAAFREVADALGSEPGVGLYGVALDSADAARAYVADNGLDFPIVARTDPRLVAYFRIGGVPAVVVVDEGGRMAYARVGVLPTGVAVDSIVAAARRRAPKPVDP